MGQSELKALSATNHLYQAYEATQLARAGAPVSKYSVPTGKGDFTVISQPIPITSKGQKVYFGKDGAYVLGNGGKQEALPAGSEIKVLPKAWVQTPYGAEVTLADFYDSVQNGKEEELLGETIDNKVDFLNEFQSNLRTAKKQDITRTWSDKHIKWAQQDAKTLGKDAIKFFDGLKETKPELYDFHETNSAYGQMPSLEFMDRVQDVSYDSIGVKPEHANYPHLDVTKANITETPTSYIVSAEFKGTPDKSAGEYKLRLADKDSVADLVLNKTANQITIQSGADVYTLNDTIQINGNKITAELPKDKFRPSNITAVKPSVRATQSASPTIVDHLDTENSYFTAQTNFVDGTDGINTGAGGIPLAEITDVSVNYSATTGKTEVKLDMGSKFSDSSVCWDDNFMISFGGADARWGGDKNGGWEYIKYPDGTNVTWKDDPIYVNPAKTNELVFRFDTKKLSSDYTMGDSVFAYAAVLDNCDNNKGTIDSFDSGSHIVTTPPIPPTPKATPITLHLSEGEALWPTSPLKYQGIGDDQTASNNRVNFENDATPFIAPGNKATVWTKEIAGIDSFKYEVQATYWTDNSFPVDPHQHDVPYLVLKKDAKTGKVLDAALTTHLGFTYPTEEELSDILQNGVKVELWSHEYFTKNKPALWKPGTKVAQSQQQVWTMDPAVDKDKDSMNRYTGGKGRDASFGGENGEVFDLIRLVYGSEKEAFARERSEVMSGQDYTNKPWIVFENKDKYKATQIGTRANTDSGQIESSVVRDGDKILGKVDGQVKGEIPVSRYWEDGSKTFAITPDVDSNLGKYKFDVVGLQDSQYDLTLLLTDSEIPLATDKKIGKDQKHFWYSEAGKMLVDVDTNGDGIADCSGLTNPDDCAPGQMPKDGEATVYAGIGALVIGGLVAIAAGYKAWRNKKSKVKDNNNEYSDSEDEDYREKDLRLRRL